MTPIKTIAAQIDKEQHKKQSVIRQAENYKRFRGKNEQAKDKKSVPSV